MIIIGLNVYHPDASACILVDGELIAAAEEERFTRIKHWAGFPANAIRYCLDEAGIKIYDVNHIAVNRNPRANLIRKASYTVSRRPRINAVFDRLSNAGKIRNVRQQICSVFRIDQSQLTASVHKIEHHLAHLAGSFYVSPHKTATVVSVDGFGDFVSTMWGEASGQSIKIHDRIYFPHSLGLFYLALTQFLGFHHYGDEYKVMGLAPYGKPAHMDEMQRIVRLKNNGAFELNIDYFRHHDEGVSMAYEDGPPTLETVYSSKMEALLGPSKSKADSYTQRHFDIAASLQKMYEDAFFHVLDDAYHQSPNPVLCLSGGCAMNSVANGKVFKRTPFRELFIQPAAGDAGGAIGAAYYLWHAILRNERSFTLQHAYWGPAFSGDQIKSLLAENRSELQLEACTIKEINDKDLLCKRIAAHIAAGKIIGWFQGRMEWGPRSLGNRSILCDPRNGNMKKILNAKIKRRESFRPFAPSIIKDAMAEWFDTDYDAPWMLQVYQIHPDKQKHIPAVVHVNGSGRPQSVSESQNPSYYQLLKAFEAETGIPILLNTSFNENEPVVCRPQEALDCFIRTQMDILVMENWVIERKKE